MTTIKREDVGRVWKLEWFLSLIRRPCKPQALFFILVLQVFSFFPMHCRVCLAEQRGTKLFFLQR